MESLFLIPRIFAYPIIERATVINRFLAFFLIPFSLQAAETERLQTRWDGSIGVEDSGYRLGQREGIGASESEIEQRFRVLLGFGISDTRDTTAIRKQIISEKIFRKYSVVFPESNELQKDYSQLISGKGMSVPSFDDALVFLEHRNLVSKKANQLRILARISTFKKETEKEHLGRDIKENHDNTSRSESMSNYSKLELELDANPAECLIIHQGDNKCLYTVENFNWDCLFFQPRKNISLDSARYQILDRALNILIFSSQARSKGLTGGEDLEKIVDRREKSLPVIEAEQIRAALINDTLLRQVYTENLKDFQIPDSISIRIFGSTDTSLVQEMGRKISQDGIMRRMDSIPLSVKRRLLDSLWKSWSFSTSDYYQLPLDLKAISDTIPYGSFSSIKNTSFGSFILSLERFKSGKLQSFESVRTRLIEKYTRGKYDFDQSISRKKSTIRLNPNSRKVQERKVRLWIVPSELKHSRQKFSVSIMPRFDTTAFRSIVLNISEIPGPIVKELEKRCSEKEVTLPQQGQSVLGFFFIVATDSRKGIECKVVLEVGGKPKDEKKNGKRATKKLYSRRDMIRNEALANSYWRAMIGDVPNPNDEDVKGAIKAGILDVGKYSNFADSLAKLEMLRLELKNYGWQSKLESDKSMFWVQSLDGR